MAHYKSKLFFFVYFLVLLRMNDNVHFDRVSAYEVLSDSEKRSINNRYGEEGLKQYVVAGGRGGGMDIHDIFKS
ncbi:hypothetical protein L6452_38415 [Arctium lappa]|uniref:Uncharacterized protein n=1 Tax=Arctium lappa TaxID=4217 RepID=A0ACB8Y518_ARCLA|nr:hypothetical protein L6452_38415 [Arctium lappa]